MNKTKQAGQNMNRDQIAIALEKKKLCTAKAHAIVKNLVLKDHVESEELLKDLPFINQCHLEDVFVERAITKLCGWPLCLNKLADTTGRKAEQKYKIDIANKKVYDISERKNFCCANCYKSACYLKEQLLTSPLWLPREEGTLNFQLLTFETAQQ